MADKTKKCMLVREGADLVFRMPVERLLQLTAENRTYVVVDGDAYVADLMASLNRGDHRSEIEAMLAAEVEHAFEMGAESVRYNVRVRAGGDDLSEEIAEEDDEIYTGEGVVLTPISSDEDLSEEIAEEDDDPPVLPSGLVRR